MKDKTFDVASVRQDFPVLNQKSHDKPFIYLDNVSTTQKPLQVLAAIDNYYRKYCANVHRGIYEFSQKATEAYEATRQKVAALINAPDVRSVVFTRGTTESINLVAYSWARHNLVAGDEILVTEMEHHSNLIPWQLAARDTGATLRYIPVQQDGTLDLSDPGRYFTPHTKIVAIIHQSNVLGTVNPVNTITQLAHQVGALTVVDAAQSVPHMKVDVQQMDCDFLAFSGHKMLGPTGVGILYGKPDILEEMEPFLGGGDMISSVSMEAATWNSIPFKFEAGTPNIAQVIGFGAAIDYLNSLGIDNLYRYDQKLLKYALDSLVAIPGITIYGSAPKRGPVISFNVNDIHPHDLAHFLDQDGIAIRAGHHCAQPLLTKLNLNATNRVSLYFYNTKDEIDNLCHSIEDIKTHFQPI